jgi:hypothetical protein
MPQSDSDCEEPQDDENAEIKLNDDEEYFLSQINPGSGRNDSDSDSQENSEFDDELEVPHHNPRKRPARVTNKGALASRANLDKSQWHQNSSCSERVNTMHRRGKKHKPK